MPGEITREELVAGSSSAAKADGTCSTCHDEMRAINHRRVTCFSEAGRVLSRRPRLPPVESLSHGVPLPFANCRTLVDVSMAINV